MKRILLLASIILLGFSCQQKSEKQESVETEEKQDTANKGFNYEKSDSAAVALADKVIAAHGGEESWNNTRYISWNFLGARDLVWDKYTGNVRIDFPSENSTYLINIHEDTGRVKIGQQELSMQDSLQKYIERGKQIWVNDSYWLVFPFKLKDPGVILSYEGSDTTLTGKKAEVISLTFEEVGFTPQNKYKAYIQPEDHMILQWDYFRTASDTTASFRQEWSNYEKYGEIYLASGRGERSLNNIKVSQEMDDQIFEAF